jgi:hypothetical protein
MSRISYFENGGEAKPEIEEKKEEEPGKLNIRVIPKNK